MPLPPSPYSAGANSGPAARGLGFSAGRRLSSARVHEFPLVQGFKGGYRNREDVTTLPPGIMVPGSKNVLTNVYGRISNRKGYSRDGQADSTAVASQTPILSSYDWNTHIASERHLRAGFLSSAANGDGKLQYRYVAAAGDIWSGHTFTAGQVFWIDLMTLLPSVSFNFAEWWDTSEVKATLLFVDGTKNIYEWSGGVATIKSTSNVAGNITALNLTSNTGGSGYQVGDELTINGDSAKILVTSVVNGVVTSLLIGNPGSGYLVNDVLTFSNLKTNCTVKVTAIGGGGVITGFTILTGGYDFEAGPTFPTSGGSGDGLATFIVVTVANGVVSDFNLTAAGSGYAIAAGVGTTGGHGAGAQVDITAVSKNSITVNGSLSLGELNFFSTASKNKTLFINGHQYAYTGVSGATFTGVSPDPTGEAVNSVIHQGVNTYANSTLTSFASSFNNDLIANFEQHLFLGSLSNRTIYGSKTNNFQDFSFSTPRVVGEGVLFTLDDFPTAFIAQDTQLYVSGGLSSWYLSQFTLSSDNTKEAVTFNKLKTTELQATQSQALTTKIKNNIAFLSHEPIINSLGPVTNILNVPQTSDLSYSIVNDINSYDATNGSMIYHKMFLYVAFPVEGLIRVYNMTDQSAKNLFYWEAPQTIPVSRFAIIDGELYFHSYLLGETYKLFDGYNDNGHPYECIAKFAYNNNGVRSQTKSFNEYYVEGYIKPNTTLNVNVLYDYYPNGTPSTKQISGTDPIPQILVTNTNASLGKVSLGKNPLGSTSQTNDPNVPFNKFREIKLFTRNPYYEEQTYFSSTGVDLQWELLAFGTNASPTSEGNNSIKS